MHEASDQKPPNVPVPPPIITDQADERWKLGSPSLIGYMILDLQVDGGVIVHQITGRREMAAPVAQVEAALQEAKYAGWSEEGGPGFVIEPYNRGPFLYYRVYPRWHESSQQDFASLVAGYSKSLLAAGYFATVLRVRNREIEVLVSPWYVVERVSSLPSPPAPVTEATAELAQEEQNRTRQKGNADNDNSK